MQPAVCIVVLSAALISLIPVYQWFGCEPWENTYKHSTALDVILSSAVTSSHSSNHNFLQSNYAALTRQSNGWNVWCQCDTRKSLHYDMVQPVVPITNLRRNSKNALSDKFKSCVLAWECTCNCSRMAPCSFENLCSNSFLSWRSENKTF